MLESRLMTHGPKSSADKVAFALSPKMPGGNTTTATDSVNGVSKLSALEDVLRRSTSRKPLAERSNPSSSLVQTGRALLLSADPG